MGSGFRRRRQTANRNGATKALFRSARIERVDDTHYRVVGDLTIRDVKREVVLDAEYGGRGKDPWGNKRVGFVAKVSIDRKEFGLTWNHRGRSEAHRAELVALREDGSGAVRLDEDRAKRR